MNKSRCERKCRFPAIQGGLHRTLNDTSKSTASLTFPVWCHVDKSNTPSSKRTRVAALAYISNTHDMKKGTTTHRRSLKQRRKLSKQRRFLKKVVIPTNALSHVKRLGSLFIKQNVVICDGGAHTSTIDKEHVQDDICILSVSKGDLWICDTTNPCLGLRILSPCETSPIFIRLPRQYSVSIVKNGSDVCQAMNACARTQPQSLSRGGSKHVFTDGQNQYYCVGAQPGRAQRGVQSGLYKLKYGFPSSDWDTLLNVVKCAEHAFDMFCQTNIIRHIVEARKRVPFVTMGPATLPSCPVEKSSARYYNGVGFGVNVFLRCHVDNDFTLSIVQVHMDRNYEYDDEIVCYFCFPRIGVAVALRHGDFLLFNPQEPHCISSRCNIEDQLYCISSYLKTRVVGLNDNSNLLI